MNCVQMFIIFVICETAAGQLCASTSIIHVDTIKFQSNQKLFHCIRYLDRWFRQFRLFGCVALANAFLSIFFVVRTIFSCENILFFH